MREAGSNCLQWGACLCSVGASLLYVECILVRVRAFLAVLFCGIGLAFPRVGVAQDRWQVTLHSGTILWDLRLVQLAGDALVFRRTDAPTTLRLPVTQVDELRLVQKAEKRQQAPDGQGMGNGLTGGSDLVWQLTLLDRSERLDVLHEILAEHPPGR